MLKPNHAWKWYFDPKIGSLMLDLGQNMAFQVAISQKLLIPDAFIDTAFNVDDALLFQTYLDAISGLELSNARKLELALNAVAAHHFHKPLLPKSWFFHTQIELMIPEVGSIVELSNDLGRGFFMVIENAGTASLCMLAEETPFKLTETKEMSFCSSIKSMNNRLFFPQQSYLTPENYALVG